MESEVYYEIAKTRAEVARDLVAELLEICPDSQFDEDGARGNSASRAALRAAIEIVEHNPPRSWQGDYMAAHWSGLTEAAMRIISAVEIEMYDPRSHPNRYPRRVDNESTSD